MNFAWFPLRNPGLEPIPFGFLCGVVGTLISKDTSSQDRFDELSVRALTGLERRRPSPIDARIQPGGSPAGF